MLEWFRGEGKWLGGWLTFAIALFGIVLLVIGAWPAAFSTPDWRGWAAFPSRLGIVLLGALCTQLVTPVLVRRIRESFDVEDASFREKRNKKPQRVVWARLRALSTPGCSLR
jgi:hypothetical protein